MWCSRLEFFFGYRFYRVAALIATSLSILLLVLVLSPAAHATQTIPYKVNFQGRLTDSTGNIKPNGQYNVKFRLMSASSGGTNLWQADRVYGASDHTVTVTNGLFSIQLGDTSQGDPALSPTLFNTATNATVYLEVELPTPATATCATNGCATFTEGAMTPRSLLGSAAYAFNADTIDGIDSTSLAQLSANQTLSGNNTFTGTVLNKLDSTTAFQIQKADGTALLVADTTNLTLKVGGGDVSPDASPALIVLDYKNTSGDPTGTNGAMYYNSNTNVFRCYQNSAWKDCGATFDGLGSSLFARIDTDNTFAGKNTFNNTTTVSGSSLVGFNIQGASGSYTLQNSGTGTYLYSDGTRTHLGITPSGSAGAGVTPTDTSSDVLVVANAGFSSSLGFGIGAAVNAGVGSAGNLLDNGGFEFDCAGWHGNCSIDASARTGNKAAKYVMSTSSSVGVIDSRFIAAHPGEQFYAQSYIKTSAVTTGTAVAAICYFDKDGTWLSVCDSSGGGNPGTTYTLTTVTGAPAPANTAYVNFRFVNFGGGSTAGSWYYDDAYVTRTDHAENVGINGNLTLNSTQTVTNNSLIGFNLQGSTGAYTLQSTGNGSYLYTDGTTLHMGVTASGSAGAGVGVSAAYSNDAIVLASAGTGQAASINAGTEFGSNLVDNGGFEFGCAGWTNDAGGTATVSCDTASPHGGNKQLKMVQGTLTGWNASYSHHIAAVPGETYYAQGWVKTSAATTGTGAYVIAFYDKNGTYVNGQTSVTTNPGTSYTFRSVSVTAPANTVYALVYPIVVGDGSTGGTWYFDDIYAGRSDHPEFATFTGGLTVNSTQTLTNNNLIGLNIQGTTGAYTLQSAGTGTYLYSDGTDTHLGIAASGSAGSGVGPTSQGDDVIVLANASPGIAASINTGVSFGGNLVSNGGFEFGCSGWRGYGTNTGTVSCPATTPHSGYKRLDLVQSAPSGANYVYHHLIAAQPGETYYAQGWIKTSAVTTGTGGYQIGFYDKTYTFISSVATDLTNPGTSYAFRSVTGTAPANTAFMQIVPTVDGDGSTAGTWSFDDVYAIRSDHPEAATFKNAANSTTAFNIQNANGDALLVGDTTNMALKVGGGDVSPSATPTLFVLDYKNTSGDPTGVNGAMYYNSSSGKMRCYESSIWQDCIRSPYSSYDYDTDFMTRAVYTTNGASLDDTLTTVTAGTGSQVGPTTGVAGRPGIVRLTTGTTNTGIGGVANQLDSIVLGGSNTWDITGAVSLATLSDGTDTYLATFGFRDSAATNGCSIQYKHDVNSGKWQGVCTSAGSSTTCDTTVTAAASTWYKLKISVNAAANSVVFSVNGTTCSSPITTNIPTAGIGFLALISKTAGTTSRTMDIDYMHVTSSGNMSR